jgi:nucleoside-diphosphate-sugar epimerase
MATVLVTGASGFIGRFLVLELLKKGDTVWVMLRKPRQQLAELQHWLHGYGVDGERLFAVYGDLEQPGAGISPADWQALQAVTVIYHAAALFGWNLSEAQARQINITGVLELLTLASAKLQLQRLVQVSGYMLSIKAHLRNIGIKEEGTTDWARVYQQVGVYEASKIEAHYAIKAKAAVLQIPLTVVHPATAIGHSQTGEVAANQAFFQSVHDLLQGKLPAVPGGQGYRLPLVSIDYLAQFLARVADYPQAAGQEYVLADDSTPDMKAVLTVCAQAVQARPPRINIPLPLLRKVMAWPWLARQTGLSPEMLHFFRKERLDVASANQLASMMKLQQPRLPEVLARTAHFVRHAI